jgi:lipopolysaccharide export system permease protein
MKIARTLSVYLMRETLIYCALAFLILTIVLLTQNLLRRLDDLFLVGLTPQDLWIVIQSVTPVVLSYSIPLAFIVGILLSIRRLGADGELAGMRAGGIGPTTILIPHLILGLLASVLSGWLLMSVEHESRQQLVQLFKTAAARGAILEPGKFRRFGSRLIFVEERDRDGRLGGVMIVDQSEGNRPYRIFAEHGRYHFDPEDGSIALDLWDGDLHLQPTKAEPDRYERIRFDGFNYRLDVRYILGGEFGPVRPKQMNDAQLRNVLARAAAGDGLRELDQRNPLEYELEIHRRRSLPLAPLLFAGVAVPVALASEHRGRSIGLLLVLATAFGYYALGAWANTMAQSAWLPPALASWLPNIVFGVLASALAWISRSRIPA